MTKYRDLSTSEWFHVVHKGADRQDIFSAASHGTVFEELLADALGRFHVELHAYAWMTNHVHQLVHAPRGGLPEVMHRLGSRYASMYNGWTDRSGPLFTARYFSEPVRTDAQLVQTARYIHRNPLAIVGAAGLVEYRWSSLAALCGRRPAPEWLTTGPATAGFDAPGYERYVLTDQPSDRIAHGVLSPSTPTGCAEIESAIAAVTGRSIEYLRVANPAGDDARTLMITLAVECRAGDSDMLARRYGLGDRRSVRRIARRGRARASQSAAFADLRSRVLAQLDAAPRDGHPVPGDPGSGNRGGSRRPGLGELREAS